MFIFFMMMKFSFSLSFHTKSSRMKSILQLSSRGSEWEISFFGGSLSSMKCRKIVSNWDLRPFQFFFYIHSLSRFDFSFLFLFGNQDLGWILKQNKKKLFSKNNFEIILRFRDWICCCVLSGCVRRFSGTNCLILSWSFPLVWRWRKFWRMSNCRTVNA